jgi:alpha-tubulin suppressor-like RCC1 family protein
VIEANNNDEPIRTAGPARTDGPGPRGPFRGGALRRRAAALSATALAGTMAAGAALADSSRVPDGHRWTSVAVGLGHTCAIRDDASLWCWGLNDSGQLGDGTTTDRVSPVQIRRESLWTGVAAGDKHTCAIRDDAALWCWGTGPAAAPGARPAPPTPDPAPDPTPVPVPTPVPTGQVIRWLGVQARGLNTCAIDSADDLWCWGENSHGQVGDGTTTARSEPVRVDPQDKSPDGVPWITVSPGNGFTCGTRADKSLWCWGRNEDGAVGDGTDVDRRRPVQIAPDTPWTTVRAGHDHACALQDNGIAWCWGDASTGQLGTDTYFPVPRPVPVLDRGTWSDLTAGEDFTCGLRPDATLWCWGTNEHGELALSRPDQKTSGVPVRVPGDAVWRTLSAGSGTACGIRRDGTLWCWGDNHRGQIGDGTRENRFEPVPGGLPAAATPSSPGLLPTPPA